MSEVTKPIALDETLQKVVTALEDAKPIALDETLQKVVTALEDAKTTLEKIATNETLQGVAKDTTLQSVAKSLGDKDAILLRMAEALDAKDTTQQRISEINVATEEKKQEIEVVGEQVKATIPDDYSDLSEKTNNASNIFANALKGTVRGQTVTLTDVSPVEHIVSVKVRSKNIANNPVYKDVPAGDLNTGVVGAHIATTLEKGKTYTLSFDTENTGAQLQFVSYGKPLKLISSQYPIADGTRKSIVFSMAEDYYKNFSITWIQLRSSSTANSGLCSNVQLEEGATATEYTPYVDVSDVWVEVTDDSGRFEDALPTDGTIEVNSSYPSMSICATNNGAVVDVSYNRDINKAFSELEQKLTNAVISLGGNV